MKTSRLGIFLALLGALLSAPGICPPSHADPGYGWDAWGRRQLTPEERAAIRARVDQEYASFEKFKQALAAIVPAETARRHRAEWLEFSGPNWEIGLQTLTVKKDGDSVSLVARYNVYACSGRGALGSCLGREYKKTPVTTVNTTAGKLAEHGIAVVGDDEEGYALVDAAGAALKFGDESAKEIFNRSTISGESYISIINELALAAEKKAAEERARKLLEETGKALK